MSVVARAEVRQGSAAQVTRGVDLRRGPADDSPSVGRLPKGTILSLTGEVKNGYVGVDVELEEGSVSGWVPRDALNKSARDSLPDDPVATLEDEGDTAKPRRRSDEALDEDQEIIRPRTRVRIPKDEGLLLRREPTFFYGVQAGGGLAMLQADDVGSDFFMGPAFTGGGHIGYHLSRNIPVRAEASYSRLSGTAPAGNSGDATIEVGFVDFLGSISYLIDDLEIFGGIQYSYAISINDLPPPLDQSVAAAADLSSLFVQAGVGYRFNLSDVASLVARARWNFSFIRQPVGFQSFQGVVFIEFRG